MAKQLFKLVMTATTETIAKPTTTRLFNKTTATVTAAYLVIPSSKFWNDAGTLLASNSITEEVASNGYYLLFIDGVLQQSSLYTVTSAAVSISAPSALNIALSTPITLAITNFAPVSSTVVTG